MELRHYLTILQRHLRVILLTLAVTVIIATLGIMEVTPLYQATVTLRMPTVAEGTLDQLRYDINYADRLMNTYVQIATSSPVLEELRQRLEIATLPKITAESSPNTELFMITAEDPDAETAAKAANSLAEILIARMRAADTASGTSGEQLLARQLSQLEEEMEQTRQQIEALVASNPEKQDEIEALTRLLNLKEGTYGSILLLYERARAAQGLRVQALFIIEPARPPTTPAFPRPVPILGLAVLLGLAGGVGLAFLLESLDTRVRTPDQIAEVTELKVLGEVPTVRWGKETVPMQSFSPEGEALRLIRTNLFHLDGIPTPRTLLIASAEPNEGKSTLAANLAIALAQGGSNIVLVDGDLRVPRLHKFFGLPNATGLSEVLRGNATLAEAVHATNIAGMHVLTSGPLPPNPAQVLGSTAMQTLLARLGDEYDMAVLDSPALVGIADAAALAPHVDGVLLVVARNQARVSAVRSARKLLGQVGAHCIGVVVNYAAPSQVFHYYHKHTAAPLGSARAD